MKALEIALSRLEGEELWLETGLEFYGTLNCAVDWTLLLELCHFSRMGQEVITFSKSTFAS